MKRLKILGMMLAMVLAWLITVLSGSAVAVSDYDNVFHNLDQLKLQYGSSYREDVSTTYMAKYRATCDEDVYNFMQDKIANDGMKFVRQNKATLAGIGELDYITIYFSNNPNAEISHMDFGSEKGFFISGDDEFYQIQLYPAALTNQGPANQLICSVNHAAMPMSPMGNTALLGPTYVWVNDFPIVYPSGYEGENPLTIPPPATYVAMGDSFSSGEGNPDFEYGSDTNGCHRSPQAYPRLLEFDNDLSLGTTAFVACSGATTQDVVDGKNGEPSQLSRLSEDTQVVTITIGGNDVGFSDYVLGCAVACSPGSLGGEPIYNAMMDGINAPAFESNLETTYETILQKAPNAQVYVIDYPYLTAADADSCGVFDFSSARNVQIALNSKIADAVDEVNDPSLHYVNTNAPDSPFAGKHYCNGGTTDFNGFVLPPNKEYSFHPNADGQEDYAAIVKDAIG